MNPDRLDELLDAHLLGELSPEQMQELQQLMQTDPAARRRFVQAVMLESHLHRLVRSEQGPVESSEPPAPTPAALRFRMPSSLYRLRSLAIAAIILIAVGVATIVYFSRRDSSPLARVTSGSVLVDGQSQNRLREGSTLTVSGSAPAVIQLSDGSQATLDPATQLILRGTVGNTRQVLQFISGGGQFHVSHGGGQFRIDTPAGSVTVLGTQFTIALRSSDSLFVSVLTGAVRCERDGKAFTLSTGQSRLFGPQPRPSMQDAKAMVKTGIIKTMDASARTFEVTLPPRPLTFTCNDKTQITLDGAVSTFEEAVKVDRKVTVTYSKESDEERVASKVELTTRR